MHANESIARSYIEKNCAISDLTILENEANLISFETTPELFRYGYHATVFSFGLPPLKDEILINETGAKWEIEKGKKIEFNTYWKHDNGHSRRIYRVALSQQ